MIMSKSLNVCLESDERHLSNAGPPPRVGMMTVIVGMSGQLVSKLDLGVSCCFHAISECEE